MVYKQLTERIACDAVIDVPDNDGLVASWGLSDVEGDPIAGVASSALGFWYYDGDWRRRRRKCFSLWFSMLQKNCDELDGWQAGLLLSCSKSCRNEPEAES